MIMSVKTLINKITNVNVAVIFRFPFKFNFEKIRNVLKLITQEFNIVITNVDEGKCQYSICGYIEDNPFVKIYIYETILVLEYDYSLSNDSVSTELRREIIETAIKLIQLLKKLKPIVIHFKITPLIEISM